MNRGDMHANPMPMTMMGADNEHVANEPEFGMTIRERMAMAAMQGLLASGKFQVDNEMAKEALDAADCLLYWEERTREGASDD